MVKNLHYASFSSGYAINGSLTGMAQMKEYVFRMSEMLQQHADETRAAGASKYMKNQSAFFGVPSPLRKEILKNFIQRYGLPSPESLESLSQHCWQHPKREMQYCCMEIIYRLKRKLTPDDIPLFEQLILTKSWWDTVDFIAPNLAGMVMLSNPEIVPHTISRWQQHNNMWLRRSAVLHQLKFKKNTNQELLFSVCASLAHEKEFFIRKAIGWALREYAKTNPEPVKEFVSRVSLSPLSQREALKHLGVK